MATIYNLTNATNSTSIYDVLAAVNSSSDGVLGTTILTTMFLITLITMKGWENTDALAAASFGHAVLAVLFFASNLISETVLLIFIFLGVLGLVKLLMR